MEGNFDPPLDSPAMGGASRVAAARNRRSTSPASADPDRRPLAEASRRVQQLFRAAESIVDEIEAEASLEADRYLGERLREADRRYERRLEELRGVGARVIARAEALRDEAQGAAAELARLVQELRAALSEPPEGRGPVAEDGVTRPDDQPANGGDVVHPAPPRRAAAASAANVDPVPSAPPPPSSEPREGDTAPPVSAAVSEAALLCATRMAVAGEPRDAIQDELGARFGLADPAAVTDEILGPA